VLLPWSLGRYQLQLTNEVIINNNKTKKKKEII